MQVRTIPQEEIAFLSWHSLNIKPDVEKHLLGVFSKQGELLAVLQYRQQSEVCDGWTFSSLEVSASHRGLGISKLLVHAFFDILHDNQVMSLNVTAYTEQGKTRLRNTLNCFARSKQIKLIEDSEDPFYR